MSHRFLAGRQTRPDLDRWTRPAARCPRCATAVRAVQTLKRLDRRWARYGARARYVYRCPTARRHADVEPAVLPAAVAIDWTLRGARIGDRARPLAANIRARIEAGLRRYARLIDHRTTRNSWGHPVPRPRTVGFSAISDAAHPLAPSSRPSGRRNRCIAYPGPIHSYVSPSDTSGFVATIPATSLVTVECSVHRQTLQGHDLWDWDGSGWIWDRMVDMGAGQSSRLRGLRPVPDP